MLTLYIHNISKCAPVSDYEYVVMVNAEKIAEGKVYSHHRADGWKKLVEKILKSESVGEDDIEDKG